MNKRHQGRLETWKEAVERRSAAESERRDRVARLMEEIRQTLRGPKIASIGGRVDSATLYACELEHKGERHRLTPQVRAGVDQQGNVSTSQGWVMKTQHDSREIYVNVEAPDWYVSFRAAKGGSAATDAGAMVSNWAFRQESERAREFAGRSITRPQRGVRS